MKLLLIRLVVMLLTFTAGLSFKYLCAPRFTTSTVEKKPVSVELITPPQQIPPPPVPANVTTPNHAAQIVVDVDFDKFYLDGNYILMDHKETFGSFNSFAFNVVEVNKDGTFGDFQIGTERRGEFYYDAVADFGLITEQRVFFVASKVSDDGIGYRFDGKFLYRNFDAFYNLNKPVLAGTLTKTKFGRKVAEKFVNFRVESNEC